MMLVLGPALGRRVPDRGLQPGAERREPRSGVDYEPGGLRPASSSLPPGPLACPDCPAHGHCLAELLTKYALHDIVSRRSRWASSCLQNPHVHRHLADARDAGTMSLPRQVIPGRFYMITRRCTQRQFLLRPDEQTNNAFLYCLAEAAQRCDVDSS